MLKNSTKVSDQPAVYNSTMKFYDIQPGDDLSQTETEFLRDSLVQRQADISLSLLPTVPTWEAV